MKKIRNKYLTWLFFTAAFVILWNLLEYIVALIGGNGFEFSLVRNVSSPLVTGAIIGWFTYVKSEEE